MTVRSATLVESPEKRAAILEQAIGAFAQDGFRGTDVQDIADRAGVGKGTVYRYFASKENLFWQSTYEVIQRLAAELFAAVDMPASAVAKLQAMARAYAAFFENNPQCLELFVQDRAEFRGVGPDSHRQYHEKLNRQFAQIIADGIAAGELRAVDPETTMSALHAVMYGSVVLGCYQVGERSLHGLTEYAVEVFISGLRPTTKKDEG